MRTSGFSTAPPPPPLALLPLPLVSIPALVLSLALIFCRHETYEAKWRDDEERVRAGKGG
eukprot:1771356-Pyramimonas_sp.AAC.2